MYKIYKYSIGIQDGIQVITVPTESEILSFQIQGSQPVLWILLPILDEKIELVNRRFIIKTTGQPINSNERDSLNYIGTAQDIFNNQYLVFHLFEVIY